MERDTSSFPALFIDLLVDSFERGCLEYFLMKRCEAEVGLILGILLAEWVSNGNEDDRNIIFTSTGVKSIRSSLEVSYLLSSTFFGQKIFYY